MKKTVTNIQLFTQESHKIQIEVNNWLDKKADTIEVIDIRSEVLPFTPSYPMGVRSDSTNFITQILVIYREKI